MRRLEGVWVGACAAWLMACSPEIIIEPGATGDPGPGGSEPSTDTTKATGLLCQSAVASDTCNICALAAVEGVCKSAHEACVGQPGCSQYSSCQFDCLGEEDCCQDCAAADPASATIYIQKMSCVVCDACLEECAGVVPDFCL